MQGRTSTIHAYPDESYDRFYFYIALYISEMT